MPRARLHFARLPHDEPAVAWRDDRGRLHLIVNIAVPVRRRLAAVRAAIATQNHPAPP